MATNKKTTKTTASKKATPAKKAATKKIVAPKKTTPKKTVQAAIKQVAISSNPFWNIWDTGTQYKIRLSAPGLYRKNINVEVDGNYITISSKQEKEEKKEGKNYIIQEYQYSSWSKSTSLPEKVNAENMKVKYKDGVLKITLDKEIDTK